jgi:hypothetical protein
VEILARRLERIRADIEGLLGTDQPAEEGYYQVFRQSLHSGFPTSDQFREDVNAVYGITLPSAVAKRMVSRFSNRLNAELAEDHIA